MKTFQLLQNLALAGGLLLSRQACHADTAKVEGPGELVVTVSKTGKIFRFDLATSKGVLGPSSDPSSREPFANEQQTIYAVTAQPMTKSGYVHIFYKTPKKEIIEIPNVHQKIKALFPENPEVIEAHFFRVESIKDRTVTIQSNYDFDLDRQGYFKHFVFKIEVTKDGTLRRLSPK